jgi:hypothetical protein
LVLTVLTKTPKDLYVHIYIDVILIDMTGNIGIRIPSHNSLTPYLLDELLKAVATSRKIPDARKIRQHLPEKCHIAIVSTGLSYLAYLAALKKVKGGYKPTRLGKRIGRLLAKDRTEEASVAWGELLRRHRLHRIFLRFLSKSDEKHGTIDDFSSYLRRRAHAKWNVSAVRSRVSRLCELFAEKGLIDYQNGILSPVDVEEKELETSGISSPVGRSQTVIPAPDLNEEKMTQFSVSDNSWPIKIEVKIHISDKINPELLEVIFSFLKDMKRTQEVLRVDTA